MLSTLILILFLTLIAAANLSLGFALAVVAKVGPQSWPQWSDAEPAFTAVPDSPPSASPPPEASAAVPNAPLAATLPPATPATAKNHPLVTALNPLAHAFDQSELELLDWDRRRQECLEDAAALAVLAQEFESLIEGQATQFSAALVPLAEFANSSAESRSAFEQLGACLHEFAQQLRTLGVQWRQILVEDATARQVLDALFNARNQLEEPLAALAAAHLSPSEDVAPLAACASQCLLGRVVLELVCRNAQAGIVAMFDVDCLTQLNQAHGPQATSSVLRALPNVMRSALAHDGLLLRIQGKQFVLSLPDSSLDHGAEIVERLRQQVEQTTFAASTGPLRLTVSAAVLEHRPAENALATLARLRSTIVEVKSYGRNRTFLLEDDIPTPVMPPKLSLPASTVRL